MTTDSPLVIALTVGVTMLMAGVIISARLPPSRVPPAATSRVAGRVTTVQEPPGRTGRTTWRARPKLRARRRTRPPSDAVVAEWCSALARRARSGDTLAGALRSVPTDGDLASAVEPMLLALDRGASVERAVTAGRDRSTGLDLAVSVVRACASLGGPAAEPLDRAAAALRRRVADAAERRAQSAQARVSALVLTVLPGGFLVVLATTSPSIRAAVTTGVGTVSVTVGAAINITGWAWMRRMIASSA